MTWNLIQILMGVTMLGDLVLLGLACVVLRRLLLRLRACDGPKRKRKPRPSHSLQVWPQD